MNYPSRSDDTERHPDWNQNPQDLNADATTRADFNGLVNSRELRATASDPESSDDPDRIERQQSDNEDGNLPSKDAVASHVNALSSRSALDTPNSLLHRARDAIIKYAQFVGPGVSDYFTETRTC